MEGFLSSCRRDSQGNGCLSEPLRIVNEERVLSNFLDGDLFLLIGENNLFFTGIIVKITLVTLNSRPKLIPGFFNIYLLR